MSGVDTSEKFSPEHADGECTGRAGGFISALETPLQLTWIASRLVPGLEG